MNTCAQKGQKEGLRHPGAGVTGNCEVPTWVLGPKSSAPSSPVSLPSIPPPHFSWNASGFILLEAYLFQ